MTEATIRIEGLSFTYPDGFRALQEVSVVVERGEKVALLGPNGAGKSTLLLHLNGVLPSAGEISVCGLRVEARSLREVRRKVGLVFQNPDDQLFCPTLYDDVAFGPRNLGLAESEISGRVHSCLKAVGLAHFEARSSAHLSYGQKKRAALATVLSMEAEILALDEPTSNLDPRGCREMTSLLARLGRTQIIVTHDLKLVRDLCTRAIMLSGGRIVADGPPEKLLADAALLEEHGLA